MKKALETAFFLAALALGAYAVRRLIAPDEPAAPPAAAVPADPASAPGADVERPSARAARPQRGVRSLPMIDLSPAAAAP